ncbi:hypothetical protein ACTXT7_007587, partial [Hymenolepis weldensis]
MIKTGEAIQLSVIIKSEPDYTKFTQNGPPVASPLGSRSGSSDNSADMRGSDGKSEVYQGPGGGSGRLPSGIYQDRNAGDFKVASDAIPPSSQSAYSSNQMKIISVLVSIAGIFCVLLLFIIAALKCGLLD